MDEDANDAARLRFFQEDMERGQRLVRSAQNELEGGDSARAGYLIGEARIITETADQFLADLPLQFAKLRPGLTKQSRGLRDSLHVVEEKLRKVRSDLTI